MVKFKQRKKAFSGNENLTGWLFISPMFIGFLIFMLGPLIYAFYMSFLEWPLLGDARFIGLNNYQNIINDQEFRIVLKNTFIFTAGLVPLNLMLALGLALLLKEKMAGIGLFRTAIFVPVVTSLVVWAIIWKYMLAPESGFINQLLGLFGIQGPAWLLDNRLAMPSVIIVSVLKNVGLNMILFLTALQQVPHSLYEAAALDGAKRWRTFWHITFPMIMPTVFMTMIITTIGAMKIFAQIYVMTRGGPGTSTKVLVYYIWEKAFRHFEMGYAAALAFVLFFILLVFTLILWQLRKRWVFHEN
ncbi:carbohydrate ABC transporter permease [Caldalkalibacillus uzonensis]|nr:sugar ABC transporter permease [Caldalkalibacillus uzonensis]